MQSIRSVWVENLHTIAFPVLDAVSKGELHKRLPLCKKDATRGVAYLEAFGRTLNGIAPWLVAQVQDERERALQQQYCEMARRGIAHCTDPASPDYCVWQPDAKCNPNQPLVDAAYFGASLLRAKAELWEKLELRVQQNVIRALQSVAKIRAFSWSNWMMFSAMVETTLYELTGVCDSMKLEFALIRHQEFYLGDGVYGDGVHFAWDYYNSYVMQPLLEEVTGRTAQLFQDRDFGESMRAAVVKRIQRYCEIQERLIAPDGSYVVTGRSAVYRMAAFQSLAHCAYKKLLPASLLPGQVRNALTKVTEKILAAPNLFDAEGFLQVGVFGHQPAMRDSYVNTGSCYMCMAVFQPLGLPAQDEFWQCKDEPLTWQKVWQGEPVQYDKPLLEE